MVLLEASLVALGAVAVGDYWAYRKYMDSVERLESGEGGGVSNVSSESREAVVGGSISRIVKAVRGESGDEAVISTGFSTAARRELETLASSEETRVTELLEQDAALAEEVPVLQGEVVELAVQDSEQKTLSQSSHNVVVVNAAPAAGDAEDSGFDAEKAVINLSNEMEELRSQLRSSGYTPELLASIEGLRLQLRDWESAGVADLRNSLDGLHSEVRAAKKQVASLKRDSKRRLVKLHKVTEKQFKSVKKGARKNASSIKRKHEEHFKKLAKGSRRNASLLSKKMDELKR